MSGLDEPVPTYDVLGTPISAIDLEGIVHFVDGCIDLGHSEYVCVCSTNNVMSSRGEERLARIHEKAGLCVPDGYYLAKLGERVYPKRVSRTRGTDLTRRLAQHAAEQGYSIFLYGAAPGVPEEAAANLQEEAPGLEVVGTHSPPFRPTTEEEDAEEIEQINEASPEILFVGLPTPMQDRWMADHVDKLDANVLFGVGAAFDFIAGTKDEAPQLLRENGLEWLWRFASEPVRLWNRVLLQGPLFVSLVVRDLFSNWWSGETSDQRGASKRGPL